MSWLTESGLELAAAHKLIPWTPRDKGKWLAERRLGVGASDAPVIMGMSKWTSPLGLWADKVGRGRPEAMTEAQLWGLVNEANIRFFYEHRTGRKVETPRGFVRHHKFPWRFANPDGVCDDRLVQIKTTSGFSGWGPDGVGPIPPAHMIQVQHEMDCCGATLCDVAVLIGGNNLRVYEVEFNPELAAMIESAECDFWSLVEKRTPPPPDWKHPETAKLLEWLNPVGDPKSEVRAADGDEVTAWVSKYQKLLTEEAVAAGHKAEARGQIVALMGDAAKLICPAGTVTRGKAFRVYPPPERQDRGVGPRSAMAYDGDDEPY